jgi:hypothetical protein
MHKPMHAGPYIAHMHPASRSTARNTGHGRSTGVCWSHDLKRGNCFSRRTSARLALFVDWGRTNTRSTTLRCSICQIAG